MTTPRSNTSLRNPCRKRHLMLGAHLKRINKAKNFIHVPCSARLLCVCAGKHYDRPEDLMVIKEEHRLHRLRDALS